MQAIIASGPVIIENNKVLLIKDFTDDFYKFPGGKMLEGETPEDTCRREVKEELNVEIEIIKPLATMVLWKRPGKNENIAVVLIHYLAKIVAGQISLGKDLKKVEWVELSKINEVKVAPNVKYVLKYHGYIK